MNALAYRGGGKAVILPLLAIAIWINYYYGKRREISRKAQLFKSFIYFAGQEEEEAEVCARSDFYGKKEVDDAKEDYLSKLPDHILCSILEKTNFSVRDVINRTSILSTRWKYLFASMPTLKFRCLEMFGVQHRDHDCCRPYCQQKFMQGVNQILQLYSGRRVSHIEMACCFAREFPHEFDRWICSVSRLGVKRLYLKFNCGPIFNGHGPNIIRDRSNLYNLSLEHLSQASSSLEYLCLFFCTIVQPIPKIRFSSLMTLHLSGVLLASGQLENILSSSLNLKKLLLLVCELPSNLCLASSTVTSIVFWTCGGVEEIDLHTANLRKLECGIANDVRILFSFVPLLEDVVVHTYGGSMSYIFGDFARDLPAWVKSLKVISARHSEFEYFPTVYKIFRNLRQLSLSLVNEYHCFDIAKLSPLLGACPLLQYLSLMTTNEGFIRYDEIGRRMPPLSPTFHCELKEVTFCGFHGFESELEFVLYILRSATVLERMFLSRGYRCYVGCDLWADNLNISFREVERVLIQRRLHGQAISRKAAVIVP